jgi:hypothetical protein
MCGIRTERVVFAEPKARSTRRLRQIIGLDCQSMPTSHTAVRHGVSWSTARRAEQAFLVEWDRTRENDGRGIWAPTRFVAGKHRSSLPWPRISFAGR